MKRKFKIGDYVIILDKEYSNKHQEIYNVSLYKKIAKIIQVFSEHKELYILEFLENIMGGHTQNLFSIGKKGYCKLSYKDDLVLAINHLKFKKWIKG